MEAFDIKLPADLIILAKVLCNVNNYLLGTYHLINQLPVQSGTCV